ncbi:uncharacterized protein LOC111544627 isoform X2 [Piliocolobus tephrosceles]|uniref:uncharacterized protein LOC111544627 isoform X2 n=1 Tax=Piliocolobus tephrosceles TaxID=591936 RepID=UPI000E6B12A6|nr:uncharacterized protein LOC111544627 isoform X2 [Piliocolobus tephrosceles]
MSEQRRKEERPTRTWTAFFGQVGTEIHLLGWDLLQVVFREGLGTHLLPQEVPEVQLLHLLLADRLLSVLPRLHTPLQHPSHVLAVFLLWPTLPSCWPARPQGPIAVTTTTISTNSSTTEALTAGRLPPPATSEGRKESSRRKRGWLLFKKKMKNRISEQQLRQASRSRNTFLSSNSQTVWFCTTVKKILRNRNKLRQIFHVRPLSPS